MEQLQAMGFDAFRCQRALAESDQDVEAAVEFMFANSAQPDAWWAAPAAQQQTLPSPPIGLPADNMSQLAAAAAATDSHDLTGDDVAGSDPELERALAMSMEEPPASAGGGGGAPAPPATPPPGAGAADGASGAAAPAADEDNEVARAIAMSLEGGGDLGGEAAPDSDRPSDEQIREYQDQVMGAQAAGISDKPLVGELERLEVLKEEYAESPVFVAKLETLGQRYRWIRRARNDGNCFFRGFAFALFEYLLTATPEDVAAVLASADGCKGKLLDAGFQEIGFADFLETFQSQLKDVAEKQVDIAQVMARMNAAANEGGAHGALGGQISDFVVMFLRVLTSAELERRKDFFMPFIAEEAVDMYAFRTQRVDPMGEEADQLHIIALVDALGVAVRVEYLDGSGNGAEVNHHDFMPTQDGGAGGGEGEGGASTQQEPRVCLLYTPGHYNILVA